SFKNVRHVTCKGLQQPIVRLSGYNPTLRPTIDVDNVVLDNFNPEVAAFASYATINMGPGPVSFERMPLSHAHTRNDHIHRQTPARPKTCKSPVLRTPKRPDGWLY